MSQNPFFLLFFHFLLLTTTTTTSTTTTHPPTPSPTTSPTQNTHSTLDPKQLKALQSLNIPLPKVPCTPPITSCDSATPFRHVTSLTLANCSDDVALSTTALKSLITLTSLTFVNCPIASVHFPAELSSNLRSFTCVQSLEKLTGVWLSRFENLTELTVSKVSVSASGPTVILNGMEFLNSVTISHANLSGVLPKRWVSSNVSYIDLSGNNLKGKIPISLTQLENLVHLNLSSNLINGTIPTSFGDLSMLKILSLADNSLSGTIPESFSSLTGLTHLDLGSNQLNGTIPGFLRDMRSLKYLNLEKNDFHGVLPFNATFLKSLDVFKVGDNSGLCYNHSTLTGKVKIGIAPCDKHGLPVPLPPSKDSSADDSSDGSDYDDDGDSDSGERAVHHGPSKVVLGVAIGLSSIIFLILFLIICSKCCR